MTDEAINRVQRAACATELHDLGGWRWADVAEELGYPTTESASRAGRRHRVLMSHVDAGRREAAEIMQRNPNGGRS